jgi:hypothetical protein
MITNLAAAAANCNVGAWQRRWNCGWNHPNPTATRVGYDFGHNLIPALAVLLVVVLLVRVAKKRKKSRSPAPAGAGVRR